MAFHIAGLYERHVGGAYGWCLFLVLKYPKFWIKILQGQALKICRRVRTLTLEGSIPAFDTYIFGSCLAILLAGNDWLDLWLASNVAG